MARRHSFLDDLITLPWWFNLILAALVYWLLKAVVPELEPESPLFKGIFSALPGVAGIFSSIICLAALASAVRSWKRGELFNSQTSIDSIKSLSWQAFEQYIGEVYRRKGYTIEETGAGGADGGIDLIARKNGKTLLIQCKNWKRKRVGVPVVRELFGVVQAEKASGGVLVTAGGYTKEARQFAKQTGIELIDGERLTTLINSIRETPISPSPQNEADTLCQKCGSPMVKRIARQGTHKGKEFLGCSRFPQCRGVQKMS